VICWISPFTGLAGDMLLGALLDAGASLEVVREAVCATGLTGWELACENVTSHGLSATRAQIRVTGPATQRRATELIAMAFRTTPEPVADLAVRALSAIAQAEARLHGVSPAEVHLHELGGHDTLVDIVGTAAALHALGVTEVHCAPLPLGTGQVKTGHGALPCPAPATFALLEGAAVTGSDLPGETVTPTAAALLRAAGTRYGPPPPMTVARTGYGAGTRVLTDRPNVASVTLGFLAGSQESRPPGPQDTQVVEILETNLDDVTGETLGYVIAAALAAGALDAWVTPAVMKKGRPGHVLHILASPDSTSALRQLVFAETGTLGIRCSAITRTALRRRSTTVDVDGVPVKVKHGPHGAKPEHDDLADAASRLGLPLRVIAQRAHDAAHAQEIPSQEGESTA
jgi:pyridinium-3,5-bisthiocarboxylic acid mononucleotide nickel chelatase